MCPGGVQSVVQCQCDEDVELGIDKVAVDPPGGVKMPCGIVKLSQFKIGKPQIAMRRS